MPVDRVTFNLLTISTRPRPKSEAVRYVFCQRALRRTAAPARLFVFSPNKFVAIAAEFAPTPAELALICNAIDRPADRVKRYVAQEFGWVRRGKGVEDVVAAALCV
jgi:hypothetical protein